MISSGFQLGGMNVGVCLQCSLIQFSKKSKKHKQSLRIASRKPKIRRLEM